MRNLILLLRRVLWARILFIFVAIIICACLFIIAQDIGFHILRLLDWIK